MTIATVVTRGFGSFGSVNKLPTLGYSVGAAITLVYGPVKSVAARVFHSGSQESSTRGIKAPFARVMHSGSVAGEVN